MDKLGLTSLAIGVMFALTILWLIRKDHLHVKHSLWWMVVAWVAVILAFYPALIDHLAAVVGIAYGPSVVFLLAILVLAIKNLLSDIENTKLTVKVHRLGQELAILEQKVEALNKKAV